MKKLYTLVFALACFGTAVAQNTKTTGTQKFVLIEEGTGTWCPYCSDGAARLETILANNPNAIGASIHAGSGSEPMKIADGEALMAAYTPNYPNGAVNRVQHNTGAVFMNRGYWNSMTTAQLAVPATFEVTVEHGYNNTTKQLNIVVKAKSLTSQTGKYNVNAYIIEDSVTGGSSYNQANADNNTVGHVYYQAGNPIVGFKHMHVVRAMLGGPFGTKNVIADNPAANAAYTKTYSYTLPSSAQYSRYKIVAFVQKDTTGVGIMNAPIMNAIEAKVTVGSALGISEINDNITDFTVYPNPATDNVFVSGILTEKSDVKIAIVNAVGQTVIEKNYAQLNNEFNAAISLESLSSGMYFVTVSANNSKKTERLVINR